MDHGHHDMHDSPDSRKTHGSPVNHDAHGMGHMGNLKRRFLVSLALALPIILLSPMMGMRLPFQVVFPGSDYAVALLATVLFFYGGMPFLRGAADELKHRKPAMMTLISLGIGVAYSYSLYAFILNQMPGNLTRVMDFFWELATLIVIMLLGHWIEMNAVSRAGDSLRNMAELLPGTALMVETDGRTREVPLRDVPLGARLVVRPGDKIPADGNVLEGESHVNEALVTGEATAVPKKPGDKVIGGSVNAEGSLTVEVTGTGESGFLAQVMRMVADARDNKSRVETLSDRVAGWLFYAALGSGILSFVAWSALGYGMAYALERMVTVLVIACPHALGLAIPLVMARATSLGAAQGLLIRNKQSLESSTKVDVVMMDKTGTLTEGRFRVTGVVPFSRSLDENRLLALAGGLERSSSHPLALGILQEGRQNGVEPIQAEHVTNLPGTGVRGTMEGREYSMVNERYLQDHLLDYDRERTAIFATQGNTVSFLVSGGEVLGLVAQGDEIKPQASQVVQNLILEGITPIMLTGDNERAAQAVAARIGLTEYRAGMLPENKESAVREYQARGHTVMMVGDGVNDAPSLVRADVGVAIGAGTDVAVDSADVVLIRSNPADILELLSLARRTGRKMIQNLWWGAGYNIVAIPLAAGVLAPAGILLNPAAGAVLMSLSTVIVAINAMTLNTKGAHRHSNGSGLLDDMPLEG